MGKDKCIYMIKISIIIPVYNVEKYIKFCLDSILSQTLDEIELICVDDCSRDKSLSILQIYQKEHKNMRIFLHSQNLGAGQARNTGIREAKGEFIMSIDPDDFLATDNALEMLYKKAKENYALVCGGSLVEYRNGIIIDKFYDEMKKYRIQKEGYVFFKDYQFPYAHTRYIINRNWLLDNNILYPDYRSGEDISFMSNVLYKAGKCYLIEQDIYAYRTRYKIRKYTESTAEDYICSQMDVLKLAIANEFKDLFDYTVKRLVKFGLEQWYQFLITNHTWDKVNEVNNTIEYGNEIFKYKEKMNLLLDEETYKKFILETNEQLTIIEQIIGKYDNFVIFGAGKGGQTAYKYLEKKGYKAYCFVVSEVGVDEKIVNGVPVISIDELDDASNYLFVICSLNANTTTEMKCFLERKEGYNILEFTPQILRWLSNYEVMDAYAYKQPKNENGCG